MLTQQFEDHLLKKHKNIYIKEESNNIINNNNNNNTHCYHSVQNLLSSSLLSKNI